MWNVCQDNRDNRSVEADQNFQKKTFLFEPNQLEEVKGKAWEASQPNLRSATARDQDLTKIIINMAESHNNASNFARPNASEFTLSNASVNIWYIYWSRALQAVTSV